MQGTSKPSEVVEPKVDLSIYGHVVELGFVVKELDRTVNYWEKLGLKNICRTGAQNSSNIVCRGETSPLTLKIAKGDIGGVRIRWIEPGQGTSDFAKFLKRHGDGVHYLGYRVKSPKELEGQVEYFRSKGVGVVMEANWKGECGGQRSVYLDTAERGGGITLALILDLEAAASKPNANEEPFNALAQYAFVVSDLRKTGAFYETLGFGRVSIDYLDYNSLPERYYRGKPGKFTIDTNQWRWGTVSYEWIQPNVGPSVFDEYLKNHGEGIQHLAFIVADMNKILAAMAAKGVEVAQSGRFDYENRRGRFAYVDTEPYLGVMVEFIWREPNKN
jgi:catechol 2,3-dioxygenase-like lactoylglutathione lyase family enzyme